MEAIYQRPQRVRIYGEQKHWLFTPSPLNESVAEVNVCSTAGVTVAAAEFTEQHKKRLGETNKERDKRALRMRPSVRFGKHVLLSEIGVAGD